MCADITFDAFARFGDIGIIQLNGIIDDVEWDKGWIECESKSFPGRTYYFNVKTRCSTWKRPVSRYVHVPRYLPQPVKLSLNDDVQTLLVSDSENESDVDDFDSCSSARKITRKRFSKILLEIYYRSIMEYQRGLDCCRVENSSRNEEHPEVFCEEPEEGTDVRCERIKGEPRGNERSDGFKKEVSGSNLSSSSLSSSNDNSDDSSNNSSTSLDTKMIMSSTGSSGECHVKKNSGDFESSKNLTSTSCAELRLKPIQFSDLLTKPPRKFKKKSKLTLRKAQSMRKADKSQARRGPVKIVCQMYDTTTINYDPLPPELPEGVKLSNLSDTSASSLSSLKWKFNSIEDSKEKITCGNCKFDCNVSVNEKELILSESSSDSLH